MKMMKLVSTCIFMAMLATLWGCSGGGDQFAKSTSKKVYSGVVGNAFQVSNGNNNEEQPAIAYDRTGRYLAVWADYRNGNADIFGKVCDGSTAGVGLNATPPVCGTDFVIASGADNQWQPKVAYDYNTQTYLVVFADTSPGYSVIKGQRISRDEANVGTGVFALPQTILSEHLAIADPSQIEPEVVYNDIKKTFTVSWLGTSNYDADDYPLRDAGFNLVTKTSTYSPTWSSGDSVSLFAGATSPNLAAAANRVTAITDSNNTPVTNFTTTPSVPDQNTTQVTVRLNANSNIIGQSGDLTITYLDSSAPVNGNQNGPVNASPPPATSFTANYSSTIATAAYAYFFIDSNHAVAADFISQFSNGVNGAGGSLTYAVLSGSNLIGKPTVYYRSFQSQSITWPARTWKSGSVIIIPYVFSGTPNLATTQIIDKATSANITSDFTLSMFGTTLTATLKGTSALVGTTKSVDFTYTPIKNLFGPVTGSTCPNSYGPIPYLPIDAAGTSLISYRDYTNNAGSWTLGAITPYSQLVSVGGVVDTGSAIVAKWSTSASETKPRLAFNPLDGEPFVVWSGTQYLTTLTIPYALNNGFCIYSHGFTIAPPGNSRVIIRRMINNLVTDYLLGTSATFPSLSIDPTSKRMLVAWEEQGNPATGKDINAQLFDLTNFLLYGNLILVSNATGDQSSPASAFDTVNQRHLVVWEDARNQSANISNVDIYGQFVDPQGNLSGGNVAINLNSGNQLAPAVSFGDVNFRQFMILWKDAQLNQNSHIFAQLLQYSTLPQLVIADATGTPILNGALDFGNVSVGQFKDIAIKLRNDGNTTVTLSPVSLPDAPFSFVTPTPVSVNPGTAYDMTIRFAPTAAGSYTGNEGNNFKLLLSSNGGNSVLYFSGSGVGINALTITTASLPDVQPTVAVDTNITTLTGAGGVAPYSWSLSLPPELAGKLAIPDSKTGVLVQKAGVTAIPAGSYSIQFTVTDGNTPKSTATRTLNLNVGSISITTTTLPTWTQNAGSYSYTLLSAGTTGVKTWSAPSAGVGSIPAGLSLNAATGEITGKPTVSGSFTVSFKLSDSGTGSTVTKSIPMTINPPPAIITTSLASGVVAKAYNQTLAIAGGTLPISWSLNGSLPPGLTFNTGTSVISGTPTTNGTYSFDITVTDVTLATTTKTFQIVVNNVLDITTTSLPPAISGKQYSATLAGVGGTIPYSWSAIGLPAGFALNAFTGELTATPNINGTFSFTATLTDASGAVVSRTYTISVTLANTPAPAIITTAMPQATLNVLYNQTLSATGGRQPYQLSITKGGLPTGLILGGVTGIISGIPAEFGTFTFEVTLTDADAKIATQTLSITVIDPATTSPDLYFLTTTLPVSPLNVIYNQTISATGGRRPYTWSKSSGSLPPGLNLDPSTGIISGIPIVAGTFTFEVKIVDADGKTAKQTFTLSNVYGGTSPVITTIALPQAPLNASYSQTLNATGGRQPYTWSTTGTLPNGLILNPTTGVISGTPSSTVPAGNYTFVVNLVDADGRVASQSLSISTSSALTPPNVLSITTTSLPAGKVNKPYTTTLNATGGTVPRAWTIVGGVLPPGLTSASATGVISGTPTVGGSYDITVQVTDADLKSTTQTLSIVIIDPTISSGYIQFTDGTGEITSLAYGNNYIGALNRKTVTLKNTTAAPIAISTVTSSSAAFSASGNPFTIPANGYANLDVAFVPSRIQAYSGTVTLTDSKGNTYILPVTGSGIGVNVELKSAPGTVSYFNTIALSSLPTLNKPADFFAQMAADFQINGVTPNGKATVAVTFTYMPESPVAYKIVDNNWIPLTGATIAGNVVTFDIVDNSAMDGDNTPGVIRDPIVVGTNSGSTGSGTNVAPASSGGGGGCFIATAAYGSYLDPHVMVLRHFRDDVLMQSELGTAFVKFYYKHSPPIADYIAQHDALRVMFRFALTPVIFAVKYPLAVLLLALLGASMFMIRRNRSKHMTEPAM